MLSDRDIRERMFGASDASEDRRLIVSPLADGRAIQPASVDVRLGRAILRLKPKRGARIDLRTYEYSADGDGNDGADNGDANALTWVKERCAYGDAFELKAGEFALAETFEWIEIPRDLSARIEGKSSLGRCGLSVHVTAGFIDPGWKGRLTLELKNEHGERGVSLLLYPGMLIAQISFTQLMSEAVRAYGASELGSRYYGSGGVEPAKRV